MNAVVFRIALAASLCVGQASSWAAGVHDALPAARKLPSNAKVAVSKDPRASTRRVDYAQRPDVVAYIDDLVAQRGFDRATLMGVFADARYSDVAVRLMSPSASTNLRRDWTTYRARFVEPVRLAAGLQFWDDNAAWLDQAEADYGVPPEIIVGILGCETVYGRNTGSFRVVDVLTTLAFDYPATDRRDRSTFFREQLTDLLTMARDGVVDVASLRGSYAGAIGMPQFMPGSIRSFAVDYDHDGRIDLVGSPADVVGSVASFLAQHGWVRGLPTHVALSAPLAPDPLTEARIAAMVDAGSVPGFDFAQFTALGFVAGSPPPDAKLALIDLPSGVDRDGLPVTSYVAGTQNFHVVTRYNRSYFYALSVIELGATIKALRTARQTLPPLLPSGS
jgi:membrane-bound lytic murein transglycosylase B